MSAAVEIAINGTAVPSETLFKRLWAAAREQGRRRLDGLAERIESTVGWDDLVLPRNQTAQLNEIVANVRQGLVCPSQMGLGGQRAARPGWQRHCLLDRRARVRPWPLRCWRMNSDLICTRIDLSQIVSKYIGETGKEPVANLPSRRGQWRHPAVRRS